ncbi:hypothetical protein DL93DRAFT_2037084, partial [Clavulina sp. PMI_390]
SYSLLDIPINIRTADNSAVPAIGTGNAKLSVIVDGKRRVIMFPHVLHAPRLAGNLISIKQLAEGGHNTVFSKTGARIVHAQTGKMVAEAGVVGNLY